MNRAPESTDQNKRRQLQKIELFSQELVWLWDGDISATQEEECLPLGAGIRGLVRDTRPRGLSVDCSLCEIVIESSREHH